jgi:TFIIF-interacting CTD phosphatase-like protein
MASAHYNIIVFTAQLKEFADPIIDILGVPI